MTNNSEATTREGKQNEWSIPERHRGLPTSIIPYLHNDLRDVALDKPVELRSVPIGAFTDRFLQEPAKENLEALLYLNIGELHDSFYPERDMESFRNAVGRFPDCGSHASGLISELEHKNVFVENGLLEATRFDGDTESQFVLWLKVGDRYFAADPASWYYGTPDHPWYYVVEGTSLQDVYQKLLYYFHTQTREDPNFDRTTWKSRADIRRLESKLKDFEERSRRDKIRQTLISAPTTPVHREPPSEQKKQAAKAWTMIFPELRGEEAALASQEALNYDFTDSQGRWIDARLLFWPDNTLVLRANMGHPLALVELAKKLGESGLKIARFAASLECFYYTPEIKNDEELTEQIGKLLRAT